MISSRTRNWLMAGFVGLLVACGGGGGNSAQGVDPGPPPPGGPVDPPPPVVPTAPAPYAEAEQLLVTITSVALNDDNQAVVNFQLTDGEGTAITDLALSNIRFVIAKLQLSALGNLTGTWQSYINRIEQPGVGPGAVAKLQATSENNGALVNRNDGTYTYTFNTSLTALPQDMLDQAAAEGLDLSFEADRTHRVVIQFDGAPDTANPHYDWVPQSGATEGIFTMDIAATENCNGCHDPLGIHGGNRREIQYCVNCHNAGSTDANSGNTVDLKVMVHKIHSGKHLPSVEAGGEYAIWGFRDSKHDYSELGYPQDIRNCVNCHVGTGTVGDRDDLVLTAQGDNWSEYATQAACGSCHDDVDFATHKGGQTDDSQCSQCHAPDKEFNIQNSHRMLDREARAAFKAQVEGVSNSMPGQQPVISFRVSNPLTGEDYDIMNDPVFTGEGARLAVGMAWNTRDYTNTGNSGNNASQVQADALLNATANGDGSYSVTMPVAIPDGSMAPGVRASGSGVATVEGHPVVEIDGVLEEVPVGDATSFFSIDEADGKPVARRKSVELDNCLACHSTLVFHGGNRADNIDSCVSCHNPRNTDKRVREVARDTPTDGKDEESLHFKTMIHGIHAAGIRENALEIVGFGGFTTYRFNEEEVHYPGDLTNCTTCHTDDGFVLPLASGVLGTTTDTGNDRASPADDIVTTPVSAVCSSCHDGADAAAHMLSEGGSFSTSQKAIDNGTVVETCNTCHASGRIADVATVHNPH